MINGQIVKFSDLPSKGFTYPKDIEIYVTPMTLKEEANISKYGKSSASYYKNLLDHITIVGDFNKNNLLFDDVQFIDLVRRLYSFDMDDAIVIEETFNPFTGTYEKCRCDECNKVLKPLFYFKDAQFKDIPQDIYNKKFTFPDNITVEVYPLSIGDFINICREHISNKSEDEQEPGDMVVVYLAHMVLSVSEEGVEKVFENRKSMIKYLTKYFANMYLNKYKKVVQNIQLEAIGGVLPIEARCEKCDSLTEVSLTPQMRFRQD